MKQKSTRNIILCIVFIACLIPSNKSLFGQSQESDEVYSDTWTSLRKHQTPEWFEGLRFGIYTHWGLSSVINIPENQKLSREELYPLFNPTEFDAARWAKLFKDAGAQFAGPVGWHGSLMSWDSDISPNNMKDKLGLDFASEMEKAIRAEGMKFILSLHSGWGPDFLPLGKEVINKHNPDIIWVDAGFGGTKRASQWKKQYPGGKLTGTNNEIGGLDEKNQQKFIAYYFNHAKASNQEVQFVYKQFDIPYGIGTKDLENGLFENPQYDFWMTDINLIIHEARHDGMIPSTWFYYYDQKMKDANYIVDLLVDVTSKNGCVFLNVPPKADGSFREEIVHDLLEIGKWLKINGEAIYDAIPWIIYGEGPAVLTGEGHHSDHTGENKFGEADFRFTTGGNNLYAICMDVPTTSEVKIRALGSAGKLGSDISTLKILGYEGDIEWQQSADALTINIPSDLNLNYAVTFKIER